MAVCIPPCFTSQAKDYLKSSNVKIATVIGFPFGYNSTKTKVFETEQAVNDGADEIDMVINVGLLKQGDYKLVKEEISQVKKACGKSTLKVIVETCYLTEDEVRIVT